MNWETLKQQLFETQNKIFQILILNKHRFNEEFTFIGNSYSGYWFPNNLLRSKGTIWGIGLGRDSSFERELVSLGYKFIGFEPESQCYRVSLSQFQGTDAIIENYGLWDKSGNFRYTGENISIVNIFKHDVFSEELLEIKSLWEVAAEKSLETMQAPRVLKMNIEGAEREILLRLIAEPLDFDVLIFQAEFLFHRSFLDVFRKVKSAIELKGILKKLEERDWELIGFTRHQITLRKKTKL
jgi:FkbM family methyltransferase